MPKSLLKRLYFMPLTCFLIIVVNFVLMHFVIKNPKYTYEEFGRAENYQDDFYYEYGMHLPILINTWPFIKESTLKTMLTQNPSQVLEKASFLLPKLAAINVTQYEELNFLKRVLVVGQLNQIREGHSFGKSPLSNIQAQKVSQYEKWLNRLDQVPLADLVVDIKPYTLSQSLKMMVFETRIARYLHRLAHLDFGTLRANTHQKTAPYVWHALYRSLTFLFWPLLFVFLLAQLFGLIMALKEQTGVDIALSALFMLLYAIPIYLMIPLLIEKIGLKLIAKSSFAMKALPYIALSYMGIAIYSRIHRALFLNLLNQEYLLVAKAKGLSWFRLVFVHTMRASVLVTLPLVLGSFHFFMGSLIIIETLFELDGFGNLFYRSILDQDYNVIFFGILVISFISLAMQLAADLFIYFFDPRIKYHASQPIF